MSRVGVLNVYMMLDTIAMDCLYLHQVNLETLWGTVFNFADGVLYNSNFVKEQFHFIKPFSLIVYFSLNF